MRSARRVVLAGTLAGLLGVALFALLPYLLSWLNAWIAPEQLTRMSDVGQAYGGPSALLSGIAMIGVTAALVFQVRQFKTGQAIEIRKMQIELMRMLVDDPSLRPVSPNYPGVGLQERRRAIYSNLMLKYLELGYEIGYVSRESVEIQLAEQFRIDEIGEFWLRARPLFEASASNRAQRDFVELVDRALTRSPTKAAQRTPTRNSGRERQSHRWFCAGLLAGACVVTLSRGRIGPRARRP